MSFHCDEGCILEESALSVATPRDPGGERCASAEDPASTHRISSFTNSSSKADCMDKVKPLGNNSVDADIPPAAP